MKPGFRLLLPAFALASVAVAQPSTVMRPTLLADFQAESSHSSRETLSRGDSAAMRCSESISAR